MTEAAKKAESQGAVAAWRIMVLIIGMLLAAIGGVQVKATARSNDLAQQALQVATESRNHNDHQDYRMDVIERNNQQMLNSIQILTGNQATITTNLARLTESVQDWHQSHPRGTH